MFCLGKIADRLHLSGVLIKCEPMASPAGEHEDLMRTVRRASRLGYAEYRQGPLFKRNIKGGQNSKPKKKYSEVEANQIVGLSA
jgi:hypothetical protein